MAHGLSLLTLQRPLERANKCVLPQPEIKPTISMPLVPRCSYSSEVSFSAMSELLSCLPAAEPGVVPLQPTRAEVLFVQKS